MRALYRVKRRGRYTEAVAYVSDARRSRPPGSHGLLDDRRPCRCPFHQRGRLRVGSQRAARCGAARCSKWRRDLSEQSRRSPGGAVDGYRKRQPRDSVAPRRKILPRPPRPVPAPYRGRFHARREWSRLDVGVGGYRASLASLVSGTRTKSRSDGRRGGAAWLVPCRGSFGTVRSRDVAIRPRRVSRAPRRGPAPPDARIYRGRGLGVGFGLLARWPSRRRGRCVPVAFPHLGSRVR
jgi:hypothetical protein